MPVNRPLVVLAIDFGTHNTVAVLRRGDTPAEPLLFDGSPILPSAVLATGDGRLLVGQDALRSTAADPACAEPNPKRRIDDTTVLLGDKEFSTAELIAAVLRRVREQAVQVVGAEPDRLVLTHPAGWGPVRRGVLLDAAGRAGFAAEPVLVAEPVAAAHRFAAVDRRMDVGNAALVYDLGAGTCDLTVLAWRESGVEVVAVDGINHVGGLDIDHLLIEEMRHCHDDSEAWQRLLSPTTPNDRRQRRLLWDDVRQAKELLSRESVAALYIPLLDVDTHLTRDELEQLARPLLRPTIQTAARLIETAGVDVSAVYLTGGASRMPLVATETHRSLGIPATLTEQPELVIATGAIAAAEAIETEPDVDTEIIAAMPVAATAQLPASPPQAEDQPQEETAADPAEAERVTPTEETLQPKTKVGPAELLLNNDSTLSTVLNSLPFESVMATLPTKPERASRMPRRSLLRGGIGLVALIGAGLAARQLVTDSADEDGRANELYASETIEASGAVMSLDIDPDSKTLVVCCTNGFEFWNLSTLERTELLQGNSLTSARFNADGSALAICGEELLKTWSREAGFTTMDATKNWRDAVFSSDGKTLLAMGMTSRVATWNLAIGKYGHTYWGNDAVFSPDGSTIAVGSYGVELLDTTEDEDGLPSTIYRVPSAGPRESVMAVAFHPIGDMIATAGTIGVRLLDTVTGDVRTTITADHADWLAFTSDGKTLATASSKPDGKGLRLWDADTGQEITTLDDKPCTAAAMSPNGVTIAAAISESGKVCVWTRR